MKRVKYAVCLLLALCACGTLAACGGASDSKGEVFALSIQEQTVKGDVDVAGYLKAFGDSYEYSEAISCAYDGMDKIYSYPGFNIYTYPKEDKDFVLEVELTDDTYGTARGIKVGMTKADIVKAYGEGYFEEGSNLVYNTTDDKSDTAAPTLYFTLNGDVITMVGITGTNVE